ncbi:MAG TPA: phosphate ABC transporter permease subunit PstC [Bacteroidales bacterium]|nr:phosphate ABC transporter permease subunit PstC [Bacteroidales bacterium]
MYLCFAVILILAPALLFGLYIKSAPLFEQNGFSEVIFSNEWKPLSGKFGFLSFILSSLWVTILALILSVPVCILTSIYLIYYAKGFVLKIMHPIIDILAGIPSVIYGVWGILMIVPMVSKDIAPFFGYETTGFSILSGAIVLAVMIIPFMLNILIEILRTVPEGLIESSLSLGASKWQTIKFVVVKKALPGIVSSIGLGLSRAFGETIAVLMVVGNVVQNPTNVFDAGYPLPALIANNYGEMMSIPMYDSALMLAALILFVIVLIFNILSRILIRRYEIKVA